MNSYVTLSVIIPTSNDISLQILPQILSVTSTFSNLEVICVDYKSEDGTRELAMKRGARVICSDQSARAVRMNQGFEHARGDMILFHHPRSWLEGSAYEFLIQNVGHLSWGGFTHKFNYNHPVLRFTSWYSNFIRPRVQGIVYLDHCLFVHSNLLRQLSAPLWPEIDIFEDTEFCKRLRRFGAPCILPFTAETSAVRFQRNGIFRQVMMNQYLKIGYYFGWNPSHMNRHYERGINLNAKD